MTLSRCTSGTLFFCLLFACAPPAAAQRPPDPPARQPGLWEFALKKINPTNIDYGAELEGKRQALLRRYRDSRLWAQTAELGLTIAGWALVLGQRREKLRREIVTAELLAQYHNALAEARIRLEQAIADNTALREAAQAAVPSPPLEQAAVIHSVTPAELFLGSNFSPPRSRRPPPKPAQSLETSTRVVELERQLNASRTREKLLEKELERMPAERRSPPPRRASATSPPEKTPL